MRCWTSRAARSAAALLAAAVWAFAAHDAGSAAEAGPRSAAELPAPQWVGALGSRGRVQLTWIRNPAFASVVVYRRGADAAGAFDAIGEARENTFVDNDVEAGASYRYRLAGVGADGREGPPSSEMSARVPATTLAQPTPPAWDGYLPLEDGVGLKWSGNPGEDVLVYNVYRRTLPDPEFRLLGSTRGTSYRDTGVEPGRDYAYVVTALDSGLRETAFSRELTVSLQKPVAPKERREELQWKVRRTREVETVTAAGGVTLLRPADVVYGARSGSLYLSDSGRRRIFVFSPAGAYLRAIGVSQSGGSVLENVLGLGADRDENIYATDAGLGVVQVFGSQGRLGLRFEPAPARGGGPTGLVDAAVDGEGRLYAVDNRNNRVALLAADGTPGEFGGRGAAGGEFSAPTFCATDRDGNFYVSDALNARVQVFSPGGEFLRSFGRYNRGPGGLGRPKGVAVSAAGEVYVADSWFNTVQVFDASGRFVAILGDENGRPLDLGSPNGIALGPDNRLAIAERLSSRVQIREIVDGPR